MGKGIDLMGVFKRDKAKPEVAGVVVFAQTDATISELVRKSIADAGFLTDRVQKSDEGETVNYMQQGTFIEDDLQLVRLSDQMLLTVKGLEPPTGMFSGIVEEHGFYPGFGMAMQAFHDTVQETVLKSDNLAYDLKPVVESFNSYMAMLASLPPAVFKMDTVVCKISQEQKDKQAAQEKAQDDGTTKVLPGKPIHDPNLPGEIKKEVPGIQPNQGSVTVETKKTDEKVDDKADDKKVPAKEEPVKKDEVKEEPAKKDDVAQKCGDTPNIQSVLDAIKGQTEQITSLTQKVEGLVTTQTEHKKVLDDVVKKTDTLEGQVKSTVTAPPNSADRPAGERREAVKKVDDDPRTGNFDTAFLPGRGRLARK